MQNFINEIKALKFIFKKSKLLANKGYRKGFIVKGFTKLLMLRTPPILTKIRHMLRM